MESRRGGCRDSRQRGAVVSGPATASPDRHAPSLACPAARLCS
jgi:hypothetical protein